MPIHRRSSLVDADGFRRRGVVPRTRLRNLSDGGHRPPSGRHANGRAETFNGNWPGCSKEHRSGRRRRNRRSWQKIIARARRAELTIRRQADDARQQLTPGAPSTPDGPPPSGVGTTLEAVG